MYQLAIVDETDNLVGSADYDQIPSRGLLHRFVSIFILDMDNRLLLQKRASSKPHGRLFSESVSGHVGRGEDYVQTAIRRLREEIGLQENLREICKIHVSTEEIERNWKNNAFVKLYECITSKVLWANPLEIEDVYFLPLDEVIEFFNSNHRSFVPGFKATFEAYLKNR